MFAYCNNNPVRHIDSTGCYPLEVAFEMLDRWLMEEDEKHLYGKRSRIVKLLKESPKMQKHVAEAIENKKNGKLTTSGDDEFTAAEDGWELYLSTQHYRYVIDVKEETRTIGTWLWKKEQVRYIATVVVYDTYNFDTLREWNSLGNILNNGAYIAHAFGVGNDYTWYAAYTYTSKWEDR